MIHSPTLAHDTCGSRLQRARQRAGLSRTRLAALSGVDPGFIRALENDTLCQSLSDRELQHALARSAADPQPIMHATLIAWAENLHRLSDALADFFENLFSSADLAALSDHLWLKIQQVRETQAARDQQPPPLLLDNPWHDWGWFRHVALAADLSAETSEDLADTSDLNSILHDLLSGLNPREQLVLTLRYGLNGAYCPRAEVGRRLGLTRNAVRHLERRALQHLQPPLARLRLRTPLP